MNLFKTLTISSIVLFFYGCGNKHLPALEANGAPYCLDEKFRQTTGYELPKKLPLTEMVSLTGSVETNPDNVVHFVSLVSGIISNTYFSLGDKVEKGQVLAEIRSAELSSLQSELKSLQSQLQVAKRKLETVQSMYEEAISSQRDLIEAQSEYAILIAEEEKVNAILQLFSASQEKGVFQVKAPSSGIVTAKSISSGTQISSEGDPLFTISDLSEVWVMVNIYATNIKYIEEGLDVSIKTLSYPGELFQGKISVVSQVFDVDARVLKARVVLENSAFKLKPGMLVDVIATKQKNTEALAVPTASLIFDNNLHYVVVYSGDCEIAIHQVDLLSHSNGVTFIASGLQENEQVITKNHLLIYEQIKNFQN